MNVILKWNWFIHYLGDLLENGVKSSFSVTTFFRMK